MCIDFSFAYSLALDSNFPVAVATVFFHILSLSAFSVKRLSRMLDLERFQHNAQIYTFFTWLSIIFRFSVSLNLTLLVVLYIFFGHFAENHKYLMKIDFLFLFFSIIYFIFRYFWPVFLVIRMVHQFAFDNLTCLYLSNKNEFVGKSISRLFPHVEWNK